MSGGKGDVSNNKPNVVFVLGPPGSGKGTQCSNIVQEFGYVHLSAGDLLRAERDSPGSKLGELIEGHIRNGTIVPVEITCKLIEKAMEQHQKESGINNFLIDGFPRSQNNLDGWEKEMAPKVNLVFVLLLDVSEEICIKRCLERGSNADPANRRSDDNMESLKKRIVTYNNDTIPIIQYFANLNKVERIDASKIPEQVFADIKKSFKSS